MVRDWSYLNTFTRNVKKNNSNSTSKVLVIPEINTRNVNFSWITNFLYYSYFKVFRKSIKFRKYKVLNSGIVRRKYRQRKRVTSTLIISKILKAWVIQYYKLQQLWRGYQSYGTLNLHLMAPNYDYYFMTYKNNASYEKLNLFSFSNSMILNIHSKYNYTPKNIWLLHLKNNRNTTLLLDNSVETLQYIEDSPSLNSALVRDNFDHYLAFEVNYQNNFNILSFRKFFFPVIFKFLIIIKKILIQLTIRKFLNY